MDQETINFQGVLKGHAGWVTGIRTTRQDTNKVFSCSRDKSVIIWNLSQHDQQSDAEEQEMGTMEKRLVGHHHFIEDMDISSDGAYALTASWDHTLRLWDLGTGETETKFFAHKGDVLSVAFSSDNRQVVSGSRDKSIKLWNVIGVAKYTLGDNSDTAHKDWVTCVRFSPNSDEPVIVSASCDWTVKVWNLQKCKLRFNLCGHNSKINCVTVSPDGSLCASGGKDGKAILWDLNEGGSLSTLDAGKEINALEFSPNRYWLCAATGSAVKIWDLESKQEVGALTLQEQDDDPAGSRRSQKLPILCISLAWSNDGTTLFAGYTDNLIRVYRLSRADFS